MRVVSDGVTVETQVRVVSDGVTVRTQVRVVSDGAASVTVVEHWLSVFNCLFYLLSTLSCPHPTLKNY